MKRLSLLGSTGSIGTQTLEVVRKHSKEFSIVGLTAQKNIEVLKKQIEEFNPQAVGVMDILKAEELEKQIGIPVYKGVNGLKEIATLEKADTVINSLVGSVGVEPTYHAIQAKKTIALANKETLVAAGSIIMEEARKNKVSIMPIDSEHSAIFQCLNGEDKKELHKIIITCSGGPFKNCSQAELEKKTIEDALNHPTWDMGAKITVDSSTLMNKGFEVIEAHWLYDIPYSNIEVVIHPQSIVHSLVEFTDTSVMAQLGLPDMKVPIQYALTHPRRLPIPLKRLNLADVGKLNFDTPDFERFPCLKYAFFAGKEEGILPTVLNAANEVAVQAFIQKQIKYVDIPKLVNTLIEKTNNVKNPSLQKILEVDKQVKEETKHYVVELKNG